MPVIITPNMNLVVPVVGQEPGPQYATDINSSLSIIDGHNHTTGNGVPVPVAGINYNADLSALDNRLKLVKSVTFTSQNTPLTAVTPDLDAIYVSGADLYYNDGNGNQIRLTEDGSIVGTAGSITNLNPPASVVYDSGSGEFVFEQDINTPGSLDAGSVTVRDETAGGNGVTLNAPISLSADYSIIFPGALPPSQEFVTLDNTGQLATKIITRTDLPSIGLVTSASCGNFSTNSGSPVDITNLTVTITTNGGPVMLTSQAAPSTGSISASWICLENSGSGSEININRGATLIQIYELVGSPTDYTAGFLPSILTIDTSVVGTPGTYTYTLQMSGSGTVFNTLNNYVISAYEML